MVGWLKTFIQMSNPPRVNPRPFPFLCRFLRHADLTDVPFVSVIPDLKTTLYNTKNGIFFNKTTWKCALGNSLRHLLGKFFPMEHNSKIHYIFWNMISTFLGFFQIFFFVFWNMYNIVLIKFKKIMCLVLNPREIRIQG